MVTGQKYHILYKTTCTVTGNFYIGVHSTTNLEDGYMGSGLLVSRSIQKHGKENHVREILEFFNDKEKMYSREREVVNEEMLQDVKCMNLKRGGEGGLPSFNEKELEEFHLMGAIAVNGHGHRRSVHKEKLKDQTYKQNWINAVTAKRFSQTGSKNGWKNRHHTKEGKMHIGQANSVSQKGEKNSQFGTCWVSKDDKVKKIASETLNDHLENGWKRGRKIIIAM